MDSIDSGKQSYREARIELIERELESEKKKYARLSRIYKRADKATSFALGVCAVLNVICSAGTFSTAATGVGVVACLPLSSLTVVNSIAMMVLTVLAKRIRKKCKKHEDTVRIVRSYQSQIEDSVSKALEDGQIDEIEFTGAVKCLSFYYDEKQQLRKPSTTIDENLTKHMNSRN